MTADTLFQKALVLLDRGDFIQGERVLLEAIERGRIEADQVTLVSASCCLGELLVGLGRKGEAVTYLGQAERGQSSRIRIWQQ